jgi:hypothetical protein
MRFLWGDDFTYNIFIDRDLSRAFFLLDDFQFTGPESNYQTARIPGGFMSYFLFVLQQFNPSPSFIYAVSASMSGLAVLLAPFMFHRFLGITGALFLGALLATSMVFLEETWKLWNPSFPILLSVLIYWSFMRYIQENRLRWLFISFALIGLSFQFHMMFVFLFIILAVIMLLLRLSFLHLLFAVGAAMLTLSPYIVYDFLNGFDNTAGLFHIEKSVQSKVRAEGNIVVTGVSEWLYRLRGLFRVTGGIADEANALRNNYGVLVQLGVMSIMNVGLLVVLLDGLRAATSRLIGLASSEIQSFSKPLAIALGATVVSSAVISYNYSSAGSSRYLIPFILPTAVFVATAFNRVLHWSRERTHRLGQNFLPAMIVLALFLKSAAVTWQYTNVPRDVNNSYGVKNLAVETLRKEFGYTREDVETKFGNILLDSPISMADYGILENTSFSYINSVSEILSPSKRFDGCVMMVSKSRRSSTPPPALTSEAIAALIPHVGSFTYVKDVVVDDLRFIGYRFAEHPNCLQTFGNGYLHSTREKWLTTTMAEHLPLDVHITKEPNTGYRSYMVRLPADKNNDILVVLENADDGSIRPVIVSNILTGYTPSFHIPRAVIKGLRLEFESLDGVSTTLSLPTSIGEKGIYSPWRFNPRRFPAGRYRLIASIDKLIPFGIDSSGKHYGPFRVVLDDNLEVK